MEFIELTEIKRKPGGCLGSTQIVGKHCLPLNLIADIIENKELLPPEGFYSPEKQYLSTSSVLLDCHAKLIEISVAENYKFIKETLIHMSHKIN